MSKGDGKGEELVSTVDVDLCDNLLMVVDVVEDSVHVVSLPSVDESESPSFPFLFIRLSSGIPSVDGIVTGGAIAVLTSSATSEKVVLSRDAGVVIFGANNSFSANAGEANVAVMASMTTGRVIRGGSIHCLFRLDVSSLCAAAMSVVDEMLGMLGQISVGKVIRAGQKRQRDTPHVSWRLRNSKQETRPRCS